MKPSIKLICGGSLIGHGAFGEVYDSISDIGKIIKYNTFGNHTTSHNKTITKNAKGVTEDLGSCIFKLVFYNEEREREKENNALLRKMFNGKELRTLTCLHKDLISVQTVSDEFIVYQKFDNNLQNILYTAEGGYQKIWKRTNFSSNDDFIVDVVKSCLLFCNKLHKFGCIHKDIKLDNLLYKDGKVVVADYGLVTKVEDDDTSSNSPFSGMYDYMPPFCHYENNGNDDITNYTKRMVYFFVMDNKKDVSRKHPSTSVSAAFFEGVAETYRGVDKPNKFKMDMHPIGIILLQLVHRLDSSKLDVFHLFAKELMSCNGFKTTHEALVALSNIDKKAPKAKSRRSASRTND